MQERQQRRPAEERMAAAAEVERDEGATPSWCPATGRGDRGRILGLH